MLKLCSISTSTELQSFKEPKSKVPAVEFAAELVEVELQELSLTSW